MNCLWWHLLWTLADAWWVFAKHLRVESQDGLLIAAHEKEGWQVTTQSLQPCHVMGRLDDVFTRHGQRHDHQIGFFGMFKQILPQSQMSVGLVLNGEKLRFGNFRCGQQFSKHYLLSKCLGGVMWIFDSLLAFSGEINNFLFVPVAEFNNKAFTSTFNHPNIVFIFLHSSSSSDDVTKSLIKSLKNLTVDSSGFLVMSGNRMRSEKSMRNFDNKLAIERCSNSSSEFLFASANTRSRHVFQLRRVLMM